MLRYDKPHDSMCDDNIVALSENFGGGFYQTLFSFTRVVFRFLSERLRSTVCTTFVVFSYLIHCSTLTKLRLVWMRQTVIIVQLHLTNKRTNTRNRIWCIFASKCGYLVPIILMIPDNRLPGIESGAFSPQNVAIWCQ